MEMSKPHGRKARYAAGCRCTQCMAWAGHRSIPEEVRWPFWFVRKHRERLEMWFSEDEITEMKERGLDDETADSVAVKLLGLMPYQIWPGWLEAGLDMKVDDDDGK